MKKIIFLFVTFLFSACSTSPQATQTSEVSKTSEVLIPSQTPEPLSPAFVDLQEQIAQSPIYTLTPNGFEMKNEDGTITLVPNIKPNATAEELTFTITYEGDEFIAEFDAINEKQLTFKDKEGNIFISNGTELTSINFSDITPQKEFKVDNFDSLSYVPSEIATLPYFDEFIDKMKEEGACVNNFPNPSSVKPFVPVLNALELDYKPILMISLPQTEVQKKTYASRDARPYYTECFFKTKINDVDYLLWTVNWKNVDGTEARIKYVLPKDKFEEATEFLDFEKNNKKFFTVPTVFPENHEYSWHPYFDTNYFSDYWALNSEGIYALVDNINGDIERKIKPEFSNFLFYPISGITYFSQ